MKKMVIIKQHDLTDCGPACLSSIIKYYGGFVPIEMIRIDVKTDVNGTYAVNMIDASKKYGFSSRAIKVNDFNELYSLEELPCIVHLKLKNGLYHYCVLYNLDKKNVTLMDPAKGKVKMSVDEFKKIFTNVILLFHPDISLNKINKPQSSLFFIYSNFFFNRFLTFKLLVNSMIVLILSLFLSYFIKISGSYSSSKDLNNLYKVFILFGLFYIMKNMLTYIKNNESFSLTKFISIKLYSDFLKKLYNLPLNFIKSRTNGEIITRFSELGDIVNYLPEMIIHIFLDLIICVITFIFASLISYKLSLLVFILMIIYVVINILFKNPTLKKINNNINVSSEFNTKVIDSVNSLASAKYLNNEFNMEQRVKKSCYDFLYDNEKINKYFNKLNLFKEGYVDLIIYLTTCYGVYLNYLDKMNIINLFTFLLIVNSFIEPIKELVDMIPKFCFIKASLYKLNEFSLINKDKEGIYSFKNGTIKIKKLSYAYNNIDYIFKDFSCTVNKNEKVLIKGKSGSGKSTLSYILSKQLSYNKGSIKIGENELNDIKSDDLKRNITYIGQKDSLLVDSIINNIKCERMVSDKELMTICKICEIDKIINNKYDRYNTLINESSINISGGEKQRIILARGLIKSGNILILDEALSEVNLDMEERILKNIFNYFKNKTIIYISHKNYRNIFKKIIYFNS